jgi:lipopolysaccharide transport system ATP-binding protein
MTAPAIRVEGLGKRYRLGEHHSFGSLRESLVTRLRSLGRRRRDTEANSIWALRDIGFEIAQGEAVGIIGRNGAGKSTLLKVLSRITEPTTGRAEIRGRVGSLLEVGTGFHPELTGRENISLSGAILGMRRTEIERRFDEIVSFAEVERFIDTPVKRYSSGMYLRLAFAVAAHLEPEILLVDEVLAVGDAAFQKKCLGKMGDVTSEGRTVLFVSHNLGAVERLCSRCVLLRDGTIAADGSPAEVTNLYAAVSEQGQLEWIGDESSTEHARIRRVAVCDNDSTPPAAITSASHIGLEIDCAVPRSSPDLRLGVALFDISGKAIFSTSPVDTGAPFPTEPGLHRYRVMFPPAFLMPQRYSVNVSIYSPYGGVDHVSDAVVIDVDAASSLATSVDPLRPGVVQVSCQWNHRVTGL